MRFMESRGATPRNVSSPERSGQEAMRPRAHLHRTCCFVLMISAIALAPSELSADSLMKKISLAADYCRHVSDSTILGYDNTVLCLDGRITYYFDMGPVEKLKKNGLVVVRSTG